MRRLPWLLLVACSSPSQTAEPSDGGNADAIDGMSASDTMVVDGTNFPDAGPPKMVDLEWAAWPVPSSDPSATSYQVIGDVALDATTQLQWQRTATAPMVWSFATAHCASLGAGWRLPTLVELTSLVDYGAANPSIDTATFPDTPLQRFWTSSPVNAVNGYRWSVYFRWGDSARRAENDPAHARCVRSPNIGVAGTTGAPAGRYVVTTDTVEDTVTGLRWQRAAPSTTMSRAEATAYCVDLALAGSTAWRVPTIKELQSLIDVRHTNPTIDASLPTTSDFYFAATSYAYEPVKAWSVSFSSGDSNPAGAAMPAYVRCVE